jgi:hypothetical protein
MFNKYFSIVLETSVTDLNMGVELYNERKDIRLNQAPTVPQANGHPDLLTSTFLGISQL